MELYLENHSDEIVISAERLSFLFNRYKSDCDLISDLQEGLFIASGRDEWLNAYKKRSSAIRAAYMHNSEVSDIITLFESKKCRLYREQADFFYDSLMALDISQYDDPFLAVRYIRPLIEFYTEASCTEKLFHLYNRLGWELSAQTRMGYLQSGPEALECYRWIIAHRDKYSMYPADMRRLIFVAYHNIISVMPSISTDILSLDAATEYLHELDLFYCSEDVQNIDSDNPQINSVYNYTYRQWLSLEFDSHEASVDTKDYFCEIAHNIYEEEFQDSSSDIYSVNSDVLVANQLACILEGSCTYSDSVRTLYDYYLNHHEQITGSFTPDSFSVDDNFYLEMRIPNTILKWIQLESNYGTRSEMNYIAENVVSLKSAYLNRLTSLSYSSFINDSLARWCFISLEYLDSLEHKEELLFSNIINRQISTFFHSHMVEYLSLALADSILKNKPKLMLKVIEAGNVEDVIKYSDEILEYIRKCALLHDIGKNNMTDIINRQDRKLTDEEFSIIRSHPKLGTSAIDEDFILYRDVILGHHRTYDCKGGYPLDFNPSKSKVKIIIDIISICDALDAATDYLGRNYATRKTYHEVLSELDKGMGTIYNPDIVKLIHTDAKLNEKLEYILGPGREEIYYSLFSKHFIKANSPA